MLSPQSLEDSGLCSISGSTDAERLQSAEQLVQRLSRWGRLRVHRISMPLPLLELQRAILRSGVLLRRTIEDLLRVFLLPLESKCEVITFKI